VNAGEISIAQRAPRERFFYNARDFEGQGIRALEIASIANRFALRRK